MKTIQELFEDWIEPDIAEYYLACMLGIMEYHENSNIEYHRKVKGVFAVASKLGTALFKMLEQMVEGGMLEKRDDWDYRWNKSFKGYWEGGRDGLY